ncbi:MAG: Fic family protein [Rikenellaceae bacterium]
MIEKAPHIDNLIEALFKLQTDNDVNSMVDRINEKYEYWNDLKYKKLPESVSSAHELWACVKASRKFHYIEVWKKYKIQLYITNHMQRLCHEFDMNFGGSWGAESVMPSSNREQYLVSSLMEEAISSSQMEGASTTRKVAKDMLRKKISPRDKSQKMIYNNYQTICFIAENKNNNLTPELLLKIHALMTEDTLENDVDAGCFRSNNDVVVEDGITHETVHTPPSYEAIPEFINDLCCFFNEAESQVFIHPIIRGIIVHFMIAYVHPFADGNGRTARALFYWYMLKCGYWLTEYLSISRVIAKSKKSYEKAYLYTEQDENDMGYFVAYNLRVLDLAFKELQSYIKRKAENSKQSAQFLPLGNINERQAEIINILYNNSSAVFTIKELTVRFSVVASTAKSDIVGLIDLGLVSEIAFNKVKKGYVKSKNFDDIVKGV